MNDFISNVLICNDTRYYDLLLKLEYILREHIHFANNFQQERIKTWWHLNPVYYNNIKDKLYECDISHVYCNGLFLVGTIESERPELVKNPNWIKLYDLFQADMNGVDE